MLSRERTVISSSSENGPEIADSFTRSEWVTVRLMELTRPDCFKAAMMLSSSWGAGGSRFGTPPYSKMIGRAGQQSRDFKTGVLYVQQSRRFRPRGDENMIR